VPVPEFPVRGHLGFGKLQIQIGRRQMRDEPLDGCAAIQPPEPLVNEPAQVIQAARTRPPLPRIEAVTGRIATSTVLG
jgi:hypothetical protein